MNYSSFPEFIEVRQADLGENTIDYTSDIKNSYWSTNAYIRVNTASRDEINFQEYVRSDKYYEALNLLNELMNQKHRLEEIEEKIAGFLLES